MTHPAPEQALIMHFTHIDNLPAILEARRLVADSAAGARLVTDVGSVPIKANRRTRPVPCPPGGFVADYVPFYFAARSPMMYRIAKDHESGKPGFYPGGGDPLVYLVSSVDRVHRAGLRWVASDGNCAAMLTRFSGSLDDLAQLVDWPLMRERHRRCCQTGLVLRLHPKGGARMIVISHGNLLTADAEALVNTVNTVGVMGKGIALQFKRALPANYAAYRSACAAKDVQLGRMFVFDSGRLGSRRYVVNFPTKGHWKANSKLSDIQSGLTDLVRVVRERQIRSVAVPALGCGNGGLAWDVVRPMIEQAFAALPDVEVLVFPPEGAPAPADMPVATRKPALTAGRATLLRAIERYLDQARALEPREGITNLEIQKLAYFLQVYGEPLRLSFAQGRYGPYADNLNHVLDRLEGHYLVGFGDRSSRVEELRPIHLTDGTSEAVSAWFTSGHQMPEALDRLAELIDGFESPYSLELLATVHFASKVDPLTGDLDELIKRGRIQAVEAFASTSSANIS
ncbi:DarT ssDNA thymidine ADP-ribosyltransferase family protein, partial [Micromonospora sp. NPDC057140]